MNDSAGIMKQYQEAMNGHNIDKVRQLLHPQYTYTAGDGEKLVGIEAGVAVATMYLNAFPDLKLDVKRSIAAGDIAVSELIGRGTHKGEIMNIAPTGRKVAVPVCDIIEVRDGKIFAEREYFDSAIMMQQLGVKPGKA
jgi:steroid delta-isomerase-like uncharacterized protein